MHPAPAGLGEPVLVYRPEAGRDRRARPLVANGADRETDDTASANQTSGDGEHKKAEDPQSSRENLPSIQNSKSNIQNPSPPPFPHPKSKIQNPASSSLTPLPEIYAKAAPMLRCSTGQVNYCKLSDTSGVHLAFFEWDGTDTGSVLEAFRHMPEACMGSIGMILVSREKPVPYTVDGETLLFDHTIFREPTQGGGGLISSPLVHAFRAVWVSGVNNADARQGLEGDEFDRLRTIRLKSAIKRFRPAHARVIQGAVRGIPNPDLAWETFENAMLVDLKMER